MALGFDGSYGRVAALARAWREHRQQEQQTAGRGAFIPLVFQAGEAFQFDWSKDWAVVGGERIKLQAAHFKLCYSRAFIVRAYLLQTHEMLFDAHCHAFRVFGGVPRRGINMRRDVGVVRRVVNLHEANNLELPSFYPEHGIISTVDVLIPAIDGAAYGVLEIDSPTQHQYDEHDINFLTGFANVLAEAVATSIKNEAIRALLEARNLLAEEMHHRVRNNLYVVSNMLASFTRTPSDDPEGGCSFSYRKMKSLFSYLNAWVTAVRSCVSEIGLNRMAVAWSWPMRFMVAGSFDPVMKINFEPTVS